VFLVMLIITAGRSLLQSNEAGCGTVVLMIFSQTWSCDISSVYDTLPERPEGDH
jgi:hypothetical protein